MAKRRNGTRSDYTEFRYGTAKKTVTLPQVFKGKQRDSVVSRIMDLLDDWRFSPFENEASTVHGIRSALCWRGYAFARSEQEAAAIVGEALRRNGSERPDWQEGQREYVIARENCRWCAHALPDENLTGLRNRPFCSPSCARSALENRNADRRIDEDWLLQQAYRMVYSQGVKARECEQCSKSFHPKFQASDARFCSRACAHQAHRTIPERECRHCKKTFRPPQVGREGTYSYCSFECKNAGGFTTRYQKHCSICKSDYSAKVSRSIYCSQKCNSLCQRMKKQRRGNVIYLNFEIFDSWFEEAA